MEADLDRWVTEVSSALGIEPAVDVAQVLLVAKDVAHNVVRRGAPVTTYLMALAVANGMEPTEAAHRISSLALNWTTHEQ